MPGTAPIAGNFGFADLAGTPLGDPSVLAQVLDTVDAQPAEPGTQDGAQVPGVGPGELVLDDSEKDALAAELVTLLERHDGMMEERWARDEEIEDAYELQLNSARAGNYMGAAQLPSEMMMATVDQAHARVTNTILEVRPMMRVDAIPTAYQTPEIANERAKATENFLEFYGRRKMRLDEYLPIALLRVCKVGNAVNLLEWEDRKETYYAYGADGRLAKRIRNRSGIRVKLIKNTDTVLWPPWVQDWQEAEIVGHRETMTVSEWRRYAKDRKIDQDIARKIEAFARGDATPERLSSTARRSDLDLDSIAAQQNLVRITNLWCYRFLPGDGADRYDPVRFQVVLHEGLRKIVYIDYNRLNTQKHPYYPIRYKRVDGVGWGKGVGHEIFACQMADEGFRNIGMDNLQSSAYSVVLTKAGSIVDGQVDRPYPGQKISTDDPDGDFVTKSLADNGPVEMIYRAQQDNEVRKMTASGLAAVLSGQGDPTMKSGAGTGAIMALIEQAGKKFGMTDTYIRSDLSAMYGGVLEFAAQFGSSGLFYAYASQEDASLVEQVRYIPPQGDIAEIFRISVRAPSAANNSEIRKQNLMVAYNFLLQHTQMLLQQGLPLLQQSNPAAAPRWQSDVFSFINRIGNEVLKTSEVPDAEEGLPDFPEPTPQDQVINQLYQQIGQLQGQMQQLQQQLQSYMQPQPPAGPSGAAQPAETPLSDSSAPDSPTSAPDGMGGPAGPGGAA